MKRLVIIILSLTFCLLSQAQTGWEKPVQVFSPNAASLGTYGQVPVNYFNGLAQISVPLTSFKVNGYELPITLSYYAGGNKPDSHPGWVGLGWNLFAGGSINRIVNGIKDETTRSEVNFLNPVQLNWSDFPGYYYRMDSLNRPEVPWSSRKYLQYLLLERITNSILLGKRVYALDTEPDEFQVNVGDISASFYLMSNDSVKIKSKSNCNFKIQINLAALSEVSDGTVDYVLIENSNSLTAKCFRYIKEIILTNNDGIKYYFGGAKSAIEFSFAKCNSRDLLATANTWHLKKIVIPNGETIELNYEKNGIPLIELNNRYVNKYFETNRQTIDSSDAQFGNRSYTLIQPSYLTSIHSITSGRTMTFKRSKSTELDYNIDQYNFDHVFCNNEESKLFAYKDVLTSNSSNYYMQLDSIIDTNKKIALNYTSSPDTRLKLYNIIFSDSQNSRINEYLFDYNSTDLPAYNSKMMDNWGYYNNKYYGEIPYANLYEFRSADSTYMKAEILTKITYPTGGTTEFVYEPHDYSKMAIQYPFELNDINTTLMCGGLRIKKMINCDMNNHTTIREFEYKNEAGNSSGILSGIPIYSAQGTTVFGFGNTITYRMITFESSYYIDYLFGNEQFQNQLSYTNGNHVTYSRVTEKLSDGSKTIYNYTNHEEFRDKEADLTAGGNILINALPCNKFNSYELERGLLKSVEYYKNIVPVKKEVYTYNSDPSRYNDFVKSISIHGFTDVIRAVPIKTFTFFPYLQSKTETTYDISGNNPVSITTNYRYNYYRLPSFVSQSGSRSASDSTTVVTKYPFDNNGSPYSTMTQKFMLNYPVETIKYKENFITDGKLTTYKQILIDNDTLFVPDKVFSTEITSPLTSFSNFDGTTKDSHYGLFPEMEFVKYGPKGNIYETKDRKGISTTYLWGYKYQHPIAEIINATYPQIDEKLGSTYISGLADNSNPSASDLNNLNLLRTASNLPDIEVNTFTYKPFVGMISKTDPNGENINFTYDMIGRLVLNQDNDNNILARYRYSYHDNGPGYVLSVSLKPARFYVQDVPDSATISISAKGSGYYSYSWSLLNGTTVLATDNSKSFNFACSQIGKLTLKCTVTDNETGRNIEKKKSITCYSKPSLTVTPATSYYMIDTQGSATASARGGSKNFSYDWVFADDSGYSHETGDSIFNFTSLHSGEKHLSCTVTDTLTKQQKNVMMSIYYYASPVATISTVPGWYTFNGTGTATVYSGIDGSGNYSYSWKLKNSSGTELQTGTNSNSFSYNTYSQTGTLTVECTVTDNVTGRTVTNSKEIIYYSYPAASVSTGSTWYMKDGGGSASASGSGGSGNYSYAWKLKNGSTVLQTGINSTSFSFNCSQAGTLTVECTLTDDLTGQTVTNSQNIMSYTPPAASVSTDTWRMVNQGSSASASGSGGSGYYSYSWKLKNSGGTELQTGNNQSSFYYSYSQPATLTVECTVTDIVTSHTTTDTKTVMFYDVPTVSVSIGALYYMLGDPGSATVTTGSGSGNYSYSWFINDNAVTSTSATLSFTCSSAGAQTIKCKVTDTVTGQTATDTKTVTCYNVLTASVAVASYYTLGETGSATVTPGDGSGDYSYSWLINSTAVTGTSATLNFLCSSVGTMYITCWVTDHVTGQMAYDTKTVICYTAPTATITLGSSSYPLNTPGSATVSASGGSGSYSYNWSLLYGSAVLATGSNSNSFSFTCNQTGTLTVKCIVTDTNTGRTTTVTQNLTCTDIYGNFTLNSGYTNYYNSLYIYGTTVSFILAFGVNSTTMDPGVSYLVAYLPDGFKPSATRTVTLDCYGGTWNITFTPFGTVYCQIVSGPSLPMGGGVNLSGSFDF